MAAASFCTLHIQPGAKGTEVTGIHDGALKIRIAAPPLEGQANVKLLDFLKKAFGDAPRARFVYPEPMFVVRPPSHVVMQPIYLRVPPGHARHWSKHCHEYNACNQPVYFVRYDWYSYVYAPYYHERHGQHDGGGGSPKGHGQGKRHDKD